MANQERSFEAGGKTYTIRFTQNALYRLMRETRAATGAFQGRVGLVEIQMMLWAGLEGARLKSASRPEPFTLDEAGDLIDEMGGIAAAAEVVLDAFKRAVPATGPVGQPDRGPSVNPSTGQE